MGGDAERASAACSAGALVGIINAAPSLLPRVRVFALRDHIVTITFISIAGAASRQTPATRILASPRKSGQPANLRFYAWAYMPPPVYLQAQYQTGTAGRASVAAWRSGEGK